MRDTGDMMEDALSEDTMMECGGDEALYDLIDFNTDISHSAPTIKDAAERLLTLLGVEDGEDDVLPSSEDEGVELDEGSDDDEDDHGNMRLLHQLTASLAQELKYSHKQISTGGTTPSTFQRGAKPSHEVATELHTEDQMPCMEVAQDSFYQEDERLAKFGPCHVDETLEYETFTGRGFCASNFEFNRSLSSRKFRSETRFRTDSYEQADRKTVSARNLATFGSWAAGWDACAAEAVRYLIEEEGLSPHHPTVLAMKSHLEVQRETVLTQNTI